MTIERTKAMAYTSEKVDWPTLTAAVYEKGRGARDHVDLLAAYEVLVEGLRDGHSLIVASEEDRAEFKRRYGREFDSERPWNKPKSTFTSRRVPEGRTLQLGLKSAQLVTVPKVFGGGEKAKTYASALYRLVSGAAPSSCGYVVDLRGNQGGNIWPMTVGVGPLLGEGWKSYELDRNGTVSSYARLLSGAAVVLTGEQKGLTLLKVDDWRSQPELEDVPVAVLIDDGVGSSGEGIAIAFKGRPNTRFFGEGTYGAASSNEGFMVDDRVNVVVTTAMMADRTGRIHPNGVQPDEAIGFGPGNPVDADDAVVERAKHWLAGEPACSGR